MQTLQKPKGFSFDRILNDPMAMFGSLGVLGALVVTAWVVVGGASGSPKDDEAGGSFQKDATAVVSKAVAPAASHLGVAKLKAPASRSAAAGEKGPDLRDAGAASLQDDGRMTGTIAEIEARQKAAQAKKEPGDPKQAIPTEAAGQEHVPGMAPDSTMLAAAGKGGFGPAANLSNPEFAAGGSGARVGAPAGAAAPALDGRTAHVASVAGAPLVAKAPGGAGTLANFGARPGSRGPAGGSNAAAANGDSPQRALAAAGAGVAGGPGSVLSGAMPEFAGNGTVSRGSGAPGGGQESAASGGSGGDRPSVGGGAPGAAGLGGMGGMGGGRGAQLQSGNAPPGSAKSAPVAQANKSELKNTGSAHLTEANSYRDGVVKPLTRRELGPAADLRSRSRSNSRTLSSLDRYLAGQSGLFPGFPDAKKAIDNTRSLVKGGSDSLLPRVNTTRYESSVALQLLSPAPAGCNVGPVLAGQDALESAWRRAGNLGTQVAAGAQLVGPEFDPVIASMVTGSTPQQNLIKVRDRISGDLQTVAASYSSQSLNAVGGAISDEGGIQAAAQNGALKITGLTEKTNNRNLAYPDGAAREALGRNMADAVRNSRDALGSLNAMSGGAGDSMFNLTGAARSATLTWGNLCDSHTHLKALEGQAK